MAEARQFYLEDWGAEGNSAEVWTGRSLENHFGTVPGLVAVATGSQDRVPVLIEVWDGEPVDDVELHDHVGETSLEVGSGRLVVSECQGDPRLVEVIVKAGWYRVRIACDKLASADEDGHADSYRCQLWPAQPSPDLVLRWFEPWAPGDPAASPHGLRVLTGANAWDERLKMRLVGHRTLPNGQPAHLFQDISGAYWEYGLHGKHFMDLVEIPASEVEHFKPGLI